MKNKVFSKISLLIFIVLILNIFSCTAFAADAKSVLTYEVTNGYASVTDCNEKASGTLSVPAKVTLNGKEYKVKFIGQKAFDGCTKLTVIKLPEGVTSIKSRAFRNCTSLKEIYIPESLEICQLDAFEGCNTVTVHCYTSNYQFFNIEGMAADLVIDILDPENAVKDEEEREPTETEAFFSRFVSALKTLITDITDYFGVNDSEFEFEFELPFDLPFDIPLDMFEDESLLDQLEGLL